MAEHPASQVLAWSNRVDCAVRERRAAMTDDEFWADVFPQPDPYPYDEEGELEKCLGVESLNPCPECGSVVACGYDSEGRPMIHVIEETDEG